MRNRMISMWEEIENMNKVRPYVFKTRLNRAVLKTKKYSAETDDMTLQKLCEALEYKMTFISDQSNQTSDGELRSFLVLHEDIEKIKMAI